MADATMRRRPDCTFDFEGEEIPAARGEPIVVALHAAGARVLSRSIKYHRPRSFFCLAGHCNACLMRVDGVPNVKTCRAPVEPGMRVERQNAFPSASLDVLGAADFFFPKGMDHHTLLTSSRALNAVMRRVVREVGGLGKLPDESTAPGDLSGLPPSTRRHVDVVVVGGGAAGLSAATAIARATGGHKKVVVVDEADRAGGSLLSHPDLGPDAAANRVEAAVRSGVEIRSRASAFGFYPEDEGGVLAVDEGGALLRISAARYVYAMGGYDQNALFADNDRPGICAARAVGALLVRHGIKPSERPLVLGSGAYADALSRALREAGCEVTRVEEGDEAVGSTGHAWVTGLQIARAGGGKRKLACDLIAIAGTPAPASEIARMHGAEVRFRSDGGGFGVVVDESGRTTASGVYACGDVCGYMGPDEARAHGERVGRAVAASFDGERG